MANTMKAWVIAPGPDGGVPEYNEVPVPTPGRGEVLVKVHAAGLNRGELIRRPALRSDKGAKPGRAGNEFAGEIAALGEGVSGWRVGDRVMGRGAGGQAEYIAVNTRGMMRIADGMSWVEAAAIPNVFITAHDAIVTNARLKSGEAVLITAGSSGVGTAAIQICRYLGADPVLATTRSLAKAAALRALGAHDVIDTTLPDWADTVMAATKGRGIDVIIDQVGGPLLPGCIQVMALKARLVSVGRSGGMVGECNLDEIARKRASIIGVTFRTRTQDESLTCNERFAADLLGAFSTGKLRPVVDRVFPLENKIEAESYMLSDAQIGKIVLTVGA